MKFSLVDGVSCHTFISTSARGEKTEKEKIHIERMEWLFRFTQSPIGGKHSIIQRGHFTAPRAFFESSAAFEAHGLKRRTRSRQSAALSSRRYLFSSSVGANQFPRLHRANRDTFHIHGFCSSRESSLLSSPYLNLIFLQSALKALQKDTSFLLRLFFFFCSFPRNFPLYFLRGTDFRSTHVFLFFYLEKKFLSYILSFWMSVLRSKMIKEMYFEYISNKVLVESWISDRASSSSFRVRYHYPRVFRDSTTSRRASRSPLRRRNRVSFENAFNLDKKHHCIQRGDSLINSTLHVITVKHHHKSSKSFTSRF